MIQVYACFSSVSVFSVICDLWRALSICMFCSRCQCYVRIYVVLPCERQAHLLYEHP